jgi:protein SCO1
MKSIFLLLFVVLLLLGCQSRFEKKDILATKNYAFLSQDSTVVNFPQDFKGKPLLLGFIFTNCPDVCPLTSHNFQLVQEQAKNEGIKGVNFILISFDPDRDKPWVLKDYANLRNIDESNFKLLTGGRDTVASIMKRMQVVAVPGDTSKTPDGDLMYFFIHTDRAFLLDKDNKIRAEYRGSRMDVPQVLKDLKEME